MISDPIFIISIIGMAVVLASWIVDETSETNNSNFVVNNSSMLTTFFGFMMLYSIFINAGDLGIVLLVGSIISLIVLLIGSVLKNNEIISSSRGYFIPIFSLLFFLSLYSIYLSLSFILQSISHSI